MQGTVMDGKLAELNSRIQATAAWPSSASPPPPQPLSAVARPVTTLKLAQHSAAQRPVSESSRLPMLVMSHDMLQLQSGSGDVQSQRTVRLAPGSAVQLVKLSGTVSVGL